jgi:hypothetical protein
LNRSFPKREDRMNNALYKIVESVETLKERLRQETRSRQKQRLQALYLLKSDQARIRTKVGELPGIRR